jgi:peptide/nickel transport system substrate-binding protein/oligopeptide transport system substrate-binding protein
MRVSKKLGLKLLFLLMAMVFVGCGGTTAPVTTSTTTAGPPKASADKQVYNIAYAGLADIKTLDPAMATTETSLQAIQLIYSGLVVLNDKLEIKGEMAKSWKVSSDGTTWTFTLQPGMKFSDGTPITSKDFAYSMDRALQPSLNSPAAPSYLNLILDSDKLLAGQVKTIIGDSLLTPDDNTLVIKTNAAAAYFLATLSYTTSYPVEQSLVTKYGNAFTDHLNEGGCTGPFKISSYVHGQSITYVPNPYYVGPKPQLQKINVTFIKDAETAYQNYRNGAIDAVGVPSAHLEEVQSSPEYHLVPILTTSYYGMNFLAKPFDNLKIRQAFALALNKQAIITTVYKNTWVPTNNIVPKGMPGYDPNLKGPDGTTSLTGNATMAKQLLADGMKEAGYANVAALPTIKFSYPSGSDDTDNEVAAAVKQWKDVLGVTVQPSAVDFETLSAEQPKTVGNDSLQFFYAAWGDDYPDPQDFLTLQFDKNSPNNQTNYGQNTSADAATQVTTQQNLEKADVEQNAATRYKEYNDAEQQLVNDVAWLPMAQWARSRLLKTYVVGRVFNAGDFIPQADWGNIYIAAH